MASIIVGQVIETGKLTYNTDPTTEDGKVIGLGSIKVRLISDTDTENINDVYARPLSLNFTFVPLNGEHVILLPATSVDQVSPKLKNTTYYYLPFPVNSTDDAVINQLNNTTLRTSKKESPTLRTENPFLPGKTFPFPCRPISPLQPYEGEFIIQNRTGASIRLGTGTSNNPQYSKKPQHHKDTRKGDPTFAMTLERPGSPKLRPVNDKSSTIDFNKSQSDKRKSQTYRIENLSNNLTGIFAGISQRYSKVRLGRGRRFETKGIPRFNKPQILLDTSRIVLNAKKDNIFMIAKNKAILEARKFFIATDEHNVDFDELVNRVQELAKQLHRLTSAQAFYSTPFGPTGPASNLVQVLRIHILCQKFELLPPNLFVLAPEPRLDSFDFGINSISPYTISRRLKGGGGGSGSPGGGGGSGSPAGGGGGGQGGGGNSSSPVAGQSSQEVQTRQDYINLLSSINSKDINSSYDPSVDLPNFIDPNCGLPKLGSGCSVDSNGNIIVKEGDGLTVQQPVSASLPPIEEQEESKVEQIKVLESDKECKGIVYEFIADRFFGLSGAQKKVSYDVALLLGDSKSCRGWYLLDNKEDGISILSEDTKLTDDILADDKCLSDNILRKRCSKDDEFLNVRVKKLNRTVKFN